MTSVSSSVIEPSLKVEESPGVLPPCRVCGEKASGFHYGANTCEACKGFFRRSLVRNVKYKCSSKNACEIVPGKRHVCAACRYMKCLTAGMSKNAIKTGRYTYEKRTRDIEEVKKLEQKARSKDDGTMLSLPSNKIKELDDMIEHITKIHLEHTPHTPEFFATLPEREAKFLERRALKEQMFGPMQSLSREDYQEIYESTGIDIDGRREMVAQMIPTIEKAIKRCITFAKALPGFKDLPIEDQIALIKASRLHTLLIQWSHLINCETFTCYSPLNMDFLHLDDYSSIFGFHEEIHQIALLASRCSILELTPEEQAIMAALSIMCSPVPLSHIGWIIREASVDKLSSAMMLLLERGRENPAVEYGNIIAILTDFKAICSSALSVIEEDLLVHYPGIIQPDIHKIYCEITGYDATKEHTSSETKSIPIVDTPMDLLTIDVPDEMEDTAQDDQPLLKCEDKVEQECQFMNNGRLPTLGQVQAFGGRPLSVCPIKMLSKAINAFNLLGNKAIGYQ